MKLFDHKILNNLHFILIATFISVCVFVGAATKEHAFNTECVVRFTQYAIWSSEMNANAYFGLCVMDNNLGTHSLTFKDIDK